MSAGWEVKKLKDVCTFINGKAYKKAELLTEGKYRVLRVGNFFTSKHWYYSDLELDEDKYCDNGDLLYAWSASFGPRIWEGEKVIYHYHIWKVVPDLQRITKEFLYFLLYWDIDKIKAEQGTGTTMIHVSKGSMENRLVPIPPIEEQRRIVAMLDEALAGVQQATANTERNLANTQELFNAHLQAIFANPADGWEEKTLGEVLDFYNGFAFRSKDAVTNSNTQVIRMGNLYQNQLDLERRPVYYPDEFAANYKNYLLVENDLIISLTGTTGKEDYGFTVKIPKCERSLLLNQRIAKIVILDQSQTSRNFLHHYLHSRTFLDKLYKTANGTRQANLSTRTMKTIPVILPSIQEQRAIVAQLDALAAETQRLQAIYQQKLAALQELKQAILQQAFTPNTKVRRTFEVRRT